MAPVNSIIAQFENIALKQQESEISIPDKQRVRVERYRMPLRQATLTFASRSEMTVASSPKRGSLLVSSTSRKLTEKQATPPSDQDTPMAGPDAAQLANKADESIELPSVLPTPSETSADASSNCSHTPEVNSPRKARHRRMPSSRSRRSLVKGKTSKSLLDEEAERRLRDISGQTLVPAPGTEEMAKTSPSKQMQADMLNHGVKALDMDWKVETSFGKDNSGTRKEDTLVALSQIDDLNKQPESESEVEDEDSTAARKQRSELKKLKQEENKKLWEARKRQAEKAASRKSSRASMLLSKASEMASKVTSTVLGKRVREAVGLERPDSTASQKSSKKVKLSDVPESTSATTLVPDKSTNQIQHRNPRDKRYLTSGLYAGQDASTDALVLGSKSRKRKANTPPDTTQDPTIPSRKSNSVLPLPMYAGARLIESGRDFKLPYDIFSPLPSGQPKPDAYRQVNKNVFIGDASHYAQPAKKLEHSVCMCTPAAGCDSDCMNRFMYYECTSQNCNLTAEQCGNRAFAQLKDRVKRGGKFSVGVDVVRTADGRGYGVRSNRCFEPGQIIVEYTGEVITQEECERRMHEVYRDNQCYYLMAFHSSLILDATRGSVARFINHSCAPNCTMEKWTVDNKPRMALFAGDRGIMTGEELTYDYNFDPYSTENVQVCRCGSKECRGYLGKKPSDVEVKKRVKLEAEAARKRAEEDRIAREKEREGKEGERKQRGMKGWAYVLEPVTDSEDDEEEEKQQLLGRSASKKKASKPAVKKRTRKSEIETVEKKEETEDEVEQERPSKIRRVLSKKVNEVRSKIGSSKGRTRGVKLPGGYADDKLEHEEDKEIKRPTSSLLKKADSLKKSIGRSLRGTA